MNQNKHLIAEAIEVVNDYNRAIKRKDYLIEELEKLEPTENILNLITALRKING